MFIVRKETCQPGNQCGSLMCFCNSISTTLEVCGAEGTSYIQALPTRLTVVGGIILVVVCGHTTISYRDRLNVKH